MADLIIYNNPEEYFNKIYNVQCEIKEDNQLVFWNNVNDYTSYDFHGSEDSYDQSDFINFEFEEDLPKTDWSYYTAAAASGLLTGLLGSFPADFFNIKSFGVISQDKINAVIIKAAKICGYKKDNETGALKYIIDSANKLYKKTIKDNDQNSELIKDLEKHPTLSGLLFCLLTQYTKLRFTYDKKEGLVTKKLPGYYAVGDNVEEKLVFGFLYWIYYVLEAQEKTNGELFESGILPKGILSILSDISGLKIVSYNSTNKTQGEKDFSDILEKAFHGTKREEESGFVKYFNLHEVSKEYCPTVVLDTFTVTLNECITRGVYFIKQSAYLVKQTKIKKLKELLNINLLSILPDNNRVVSRMLLISSGIYEAVDLIGAFAKAYLNYKLTKKVSIKTIISNINIAGIGRFVFACVSDSKYWADDLKFVFHRFTNNKSKINENDNADYSEEAKAYQFLVLSGEQARALYSLQSLAVKYDILHTSNKDTAVMKEVWHREWRYSILQNVGVSSEDYFVDDEDIIYEDLYKAGKIDDNIRWLYLLSMELALFKPYFPLGFLNDIGFKNLKYSYNYVNEKYVRRQTIISQNEVDSIQKHYSSYKKMVSGSNKNKAISIGAVAIATITSGGAALVFAPQIAVALVGESFAGLYGAALVNASLAAIGGGSLAAGGLGMAGGTAIITGGGVILGMAGSGAASLTTMLINTSEEYKIRQCAKLLTFCKCVLADVLKDFNAIGILEMNCHKIIIDMESHLKEVDDKEEIKKTKLYIKYLEKCEKELRKIRK